MSLKPSDGGFPTEGMSMRSDPLGLPSSGTTRELSRVNQPSGDNCINLGGVLNSLSIAPDGKSAVVVGREVLKIVSVQDDSVNESLNLRVGKTNLNYSSVDVKWHPMEQHKNTIATAATNGAVVIWNIGKAGPQKQERVINDHQRTVNRISWHPDHAYTLLSGSQDGTMRLWDIRDPANCKVVFDGKSESVRDVQFSPHYANYFAAAFDNGTVQIWDIRKHSSYERKITAHQGPVFCIDWHPEDQSLIATGGRDRLIQIWDLNGTTAKPTSTVQTVSSVSHINWRPNCKFHIAASALVDSKIHVWDVKRPSIPVLSFVGHQDIATDILWNRQSGGSTDIGKQKIFSCAKDSFLMVQGVKEAYRPYEHIRTVGMSWNPQGQLSISMEKINRNEDANSANISITGSGLLPFFPFNASSSNFEISKNFKKGKMYCLNSDNPKKKKSQIEGEFNITTCTYLAKHYMFCDDQHLFEEVCDHNSKAAKNAKLDQIAATWDMIKLLFSEPVHRSGEILPNIDLSIPEPPTPPSEMKRLDQSIPELYDSPLLVDDIMSTPTGKDQIIPFSPFPNSALDDLLSSDVTPLSPLPTASLEKPFPIMRKESRDHHRSETNLHLLNNGNGSSSHNTTQEIEEPTFERFFQSSIFWDPEPSMWETLKFYAENGDVQTSVVMLMVLGSRLGNVDRKLALQWTLSYIDLLQRLQLWNFANEIITKSDEYSIRSVNQKSTSLHTSCPYCNKPLNKNGFSCENCKKYTGTCSICHQVVKGLYVWCQTCGHGGHLKHISEWFSQEKYCPAGCPHACNFHHHGAISRSGSRKDFQTSIE
eukprot:TRINITY_DN7390_c0_g2_i3.p1 TRINITY_DN7390_c0_g2~~TRINITY_DN7390_c0_g2_i3.p1  ORF type:complete len:819 (-),score=175.70 TRINITY_DN7390_c0_g2_i3:171-2627(-)